MNAQLLRTLKKDARRAERRHAETMTATAALNGVPQRHANMDAETMPVGQVYSARLLEQNARYALLSLVEFAAVHLMESLLHIQEHQTIA